jgi:prepilin-type N-terminal cleavage/methylation domain-containing protein
MKEKGFTLVELLTVIVILGIILILAIPNISNSINAARKEAFIKDEEELARATESFIVNNPKYIPRNIGDSKEVKLSDLLNAKAINTIASPENNKKSCNGYVIVTKVEDKKYTYMPHLNCEQNIGSSTEDGLVAHYTFDDFEEPTQNIIANGNFSNGLNNWSCSSGGTGMNNYCEIKYENEEPYLHIHWERVSGSGDTWPSLRNSVTYNTAGVPYSLSCKIRINAQSGSVAQVRHAAVGNDYWTSGRLTWDFGGKKLGVWQDVTLTRTFASTYTNSSGTVFPLSAVFELYSGDLDIPGEYVDFDIKMVQIEQKDHSTTFVNGSRTGVITDYSLNNNNVTLPLSSAPRWVSDSAVGEGAYKFNGISNYIDVGSIGSIGLTNYLTVSTWVKFNSVSDATRVGNIIGNFNATPNFNIEGHTSGRLRFYWNNGEIDSYSAKDLRGFWHYITITRDKIANKIITYIDGVKEFEKTAGANIDIQWPLRIGGDFRATPGIPFNGIIDDVKIYNRALTAAEIKQSYDVESYKMSK